MAYAPILLAGCLGSSSNEGASEYRALDFYDGGAANQLASSGASTQVSTQAEIPTQDEEDSTQSNELSVIPGLYAGPECGQAPEFPASTGKVAFEPQQGPLEDRCHMKGLWRYYRYNTWFDSDVQVVIDPPHPGLRLVFLPRGCGDFLPLCAGPLGGWLADVPAGANGILALGADIESFPELITDPIPHFSLRWLARPLLDGDANCNLNGEGGRCRPGLRCIGGENSPTRTCQAIEGDRCSQAQTYELRASLLANGQKSTLLIDPRSGFGDDHEHSCGGQEWPDAVIRLHFDGTFSQLLDDSSLVSPRLQVSIQSDAGDPASSANGEVVLAIRDPGCEPSRERDCQVGAAGLAWPSTAAEDLRTSGALARVPLLFVEWEPARERPVVVEFSVVDAAAP
jgi:hypothetical protein